MIAKMFDNTAHPFSDAMFVYTLVNKTEGWVPIAKLVSKDWPRNVFNPSFSGADLVRNSIHIIL